jgi:polysaccharide biosynthesis/export protein
MFKSVLVLALALGVFHLRVHAQEEKSVPKELLQYVRDAQKAGLKPPQIRQKALSAGWAGPTVEEAMGTLEWTPKPQPLPESAARDAVEKETPKEPSKAADPPAKPADPEPAAGVIPANPTEATPAAATNPDAVGVKPTAEAVRTDEYLIGEGDILQISVWGEPTASVPSATVRPDGKISMPLLKDIQVAGMTPAQVESMVQQRLEKSIRAPDVTVIVSQINSKKIFLVGAVKKEGPLKFTYRMTVLQALSEAGGLTDYAKRKTIYVLHTESGRQFRLPFNYDAVLKGEHMEQNILLSPGDTIVVR